MTLQKPIKLAELERMIRLVIAMNDRLRAVHKKLRTLNEKYCLLLYGFAAEQ